MQKIITPLIIAGMIACSNRASGKMKVSTDNIKKELVIVFDKNIAFNRDHADSIVTSYDQYVEGIGQDTLYLQSIFSVPGEDNSSDMLTIAYVGGGSERDTIYINQKTNLTENALIHEMAHTIRAEKVLYDDCINLSDRHKIIGAHAFNILIEKPQGGNTQFVLIEEAVAEYLAMGFSVENNRSYSNSNLRYCARFYLFKKLCDYAHIGKEDILQYVKNSDVQGFAHAIYNNLDVPEVAKHHTPLEYMMNIFQIADQYGIQVAQKGLSYEDLKDAMNKYMFNNIVPINHK